MTERTITRESVREALNEIVDEAGDDFVYAGVYGYEAACQYLMGGAPACIWGRVLVWHGYDTDFLRRQEGEAIQQILENLGVGDYPLMKAAAQIQGDQDTGTPWGQCRAEYDSLLAKFDAEEARV